MTSRKVFGALAGLLTLALLAVAWGIVVARPAAGAPAMPVAAATPDGPDQPRREIEGDTEAPAISFIDSPSATCYRPAVGTGVCYIQWQYLRVTATSSQYIISMTLTIDDQMRAYHAGFFQTAMVIPGDMYGPGFRVACGASGAGGIPGLGNTYSYVIRARETGGLASANYGSVICPAHVPELFLPLIRRR